MGKRLYVGNLNYEVTDRELADAFSRVGGVERAEIIKDGPGGKSKGFGFVDMMTDEDAEEALRALDGKELRGRRMFVQEARPRQRDNDRPRPGGRRWAE